jgi:subtilisin family serine protease
MNKRIVYGLNTNHEKIIDLLYDKDKNKYYIPYHPGFARNQNWIDKDYDGSGSVIAILDSGVLFSHPFLKDKILKSIDLTDEGPEDLNGHGTLSSLVIAIGAPGTKILNVKVLDKDKSGLPQDLINGLRIACEHKVDVVSISAGFELTENNKHYCAEIDNIIKEFDIPVLAAAGNNPEKRYIPACCDFVISVGATDFSEEKILTSSSKGDIYAPGEFMRIEI